ncbi:hypothetical protein HYY72_03270 [Candidatus Woesearchaeota archaeon]|nr:hypothetical protein [Candidatus Woesearchaeota archaeon]
MMDLIIGVIIFTAVLVIYMRVSSNFSDKDERLLQELKADSAFISQSLVSEGYPSGWNSSNVQKIGLTDGNYILNLSKVSEASRINYTDMKALMGTRNEFIALFEDSNGNVLNLGVCGIGNQPPANISPDYCENASISASSIAKSERLVYNKKMIKLAVYSWRT